MSNYIYTVEYEKFDIFPVEGETYSSSTGEVVYECVNNWISE